MKPDVLNRTDIDTVVNLFYQKIKTDDLLASFFTDVIPVNWEKHIPFMAGFWENVLFFTGDYEGDPLQVHRKISQVQLISSEEFDRWVILFNETIDENFAGENSEKMKLHAKAIAQVMLQKQ